MTTTQPYPNS